MTRGEKSTDRHFGLDWLRIGAFALLIPYHLSMAYSPARWVIKGDHIARWLQYPMDMVSPWRLLLLFLVSGYASAKLLQKSGDLGRFFRSRSKRLLMPLAFAIIFIVPAQSWIRLVTGYGYGENFLHFWAHDYFRFAWMHGKFLPHWEHLWFVGYLWIYTAMLLALCAVKRTMKLPNWLQNIPALLLLPAAALGESRILLAVCSREGQIPGGDWVGHIHYFPAFMLGFMLARQKELWTTLHRIFPAALFLAAVTLFVSEAIEWLYPDLPIWGPAQTSLFDIADSALAWSMALVLPVIADKYFNHDHVCRVPLSRAVFPANIVHQTAIVLLLYWLHGRDISAVTKIALLFGGTLLACLPAVLLARTLPFMGKLLGYEGAPKRSATHQMVPRII